MTLFARRRLPLLLLLTLIGPVLAGCGGGAATPTAAPAAEATDAPAPPAAPAPTIPPAGSGIELPDVDPATVWGDIIVAGSSTVFPLSERMAELFTEDGYIGQITVDSIGSGGGFERFCVSAETDIANASRPINAQETAACAQNGRPALEFRVGTDALAVVVSAENDFVENLSVAQVAAIYSGQAATWADVDPSFPAEPIQLFSPGTDSGTFDYFVEVIFHGDPEPMLAANPQLSEDDNVLVQGVTGSPYAIGYFGYAYYLENASRLKVLDIEGVAPSEESTDDGSYPLSRPLYIYSAAEVMAQKPQVASFINYYLSYVNDEIGDIGYFPASLMALDLAKQGWLGAQQ